MSDRLQLFHWCPPDLRGTDLLPLSDLQSAQPDIHARAMRKYQNRMGAPQRPLPELGCVWADCVMLSPVHPEALRAARLENGLGWPETGHRFLAFDAARFDARADRMCIWLYSDTAKPTSPPDYSVAMTDVVPYSSERLETLGHVSAGARSYMAEMAQLGTPPLMFVGIPHVLHRGSIPLAWSRTITV
ncbi:hypothetical protein KUV51_01490 [Tateyamaria omphalii]|uniref:hypothetical protein n=1 Tax=Tateyamaria omphalii TaxID=299262 RepID=UPI001C9A046A|nr:hypothetical protein [Tateyamaria omphalii]MBY5931656.1 hypothetical protein [Tateyamaria omphalii]